VLAPGGNALLILDAVSAFRDRRGPRPVDMLSGDEAPEAVQQGIVGPESDLCSLGVVLYEAFAGPLPFRGSRLAMRDAIS
jgi:hypothetical protein